MVRRALLVGINQYPNIAHGDLQGCTGDLHLLHQLLQERFGFAGADITMLEDSAATRTGILTALRALRDVTQSEDLAFLYYAGHGSYRARSGGGYQQTLVPHDSGRHSHPNLDISDEELGAWLTGLCAKTDNAVLFFDCCHSETLIRSAGLRARFVEGDSRPAAAGEVTPVLPPERVGPLPPSDRYLVLAACRDEQQAWEYVERVGGEKVHHGTLSFFLIEALRGAGPQTTYRDLFERVQAQVTQAMPVQQPRCEGRLDRLVFAMEGEDRPPPRSISVLEVGKGQVTLGAGLLHGVEEGSVWALSPSGQAETAAARARVTGVGDLRAVATLLEPASLQLPLRARLLERPAALPRLTVGIAKDTGVAESLVADLRARLAHCPWLTLADDDGPPELRLRVGGSGYAVIAADGERLLDSPRPVDPERLADVIESLGRFVHVRRLTNPRSALLGDVALRVLRREAQGFTALTEEPGGVLRCASGDVLRLVLHNRGRGRRYVSILSLGTRLGIEPVWPPLGVPGQALAPGEERTSADQEVYLPDDPLLAPSPDGWHRQFLKLLVSDDELDLAPLFQRGLPRSGDDDDELSVLLHAAIGGERRRELRTAPVRRDWAAELRELRVRPPTSR